MRAGRGKNEVSLQRSATKRRKETKIPAKVAKRSNDQQFRVPAKRKIAHFWAKSCAKIGVASLTEDGWRRAAPLLAQEFHIPWMLGSPTPTKSMAEPAGSDGALR